MNKELNIAISELREEINELEERAKLLENIDLSKPITEDMWHEICETSLRTSDYMKDVLKAIFPDAENINVGCNYVTFDLMGFHLQIPSSRCKGINIDTSWYQKLEEPELDWMDDTPVCRMKRYFDAVDNGEGWYKKAKLRIPFAWVYTKFTLFLKWHLWYRWRDDKREYWENRIQKEIRKYDDAKTEYEKNKKETSEKINRLFNELLPEIEKFSTIHYKYDEYGGISLHQHAIDKIKEEKIDNKKE